jgi:hypothetical protein
MAQKKDTQKKDVKVRDLAPKKDAKGGARNAADRGQQLDRGGSQLDRGGQQLDRGGQQMDRVQNAD